MGDHQISNELHDYIMSARVALAIADVSEDNNLVLVNQPFSALTGYAAEEVVGQNCRFLQVSPRFGRAENTQARADLRHFLETPSVSNVRTPIVNFTKDDRPFVNLLFMSRLRAGNGEERFIFASQFDVSRSHVSLLEDYNDSLSGALSGLSPILQESGMIIEGSLATIANSATMIAQAKMILSQLEDART